MEVDDDDQGLRPLSNASKALISDRKLDEAIIARLAREDPIGCCHVLTEGWYRKDETHAQLAQVISDALSHTNAANADGANGSGANETAIYALGFVLESLEAQGKLTPAEVAAQQVQEDTVRARLQDDEDPDDVLHLDVGANADAENSTAVIGDSKFQTELKNHTLAFCEVDLKWVNHVWDPPFKQREPDAAHVKDMVANFKSQGVDRVGRGKEAMYISCTPEELAKHINFTFESLLAANKVTEQSRDKLTELITDPETAGGKGIITQLGQLQLLLFDPTVEAPILDAGNHRRLAMELWASERIPVDQLKHLRDYRVNFKSNPLDSQLLGYVHECRTWGVTIINKTTSRLNPSFLASVRKNGHYQYKAAGEGDYWNNFVALWDTYTQEQRQSFQSKVKWRNEMCVKILGMNSSDESTMDSMKKLANNTSLHDCLRRWNKVQANRTTFRLWVAGRLCAAKLPGFITELLGRKVGVFVNVFGGGNGDNVTSLDIQLVNSTRTTRSSKGSGNVPIMPAERLLDLFYPDEPDELTKIIPNSLKAVDQLTHARITALKSDTATRLPANGEVRGNRRIRRPGFLQDMNDEDYELAFVYLKKNNQVFLADEAWVRFTAKFHLPLLTRAIVVVIWMFNPNAEFPWPTSEKYNPFDLEKALVEAVGWNWQDVRRRFTAEQLFDGEYHRQQHLKNKANVQKVREGIFKAFFAIGSVLGQGARGARAMKKLAKRWSDDQSLKAHIPGKWIGRMTDKDQLEAIAAIRAAPYVKATLQAFREFLPFNDAVGLGSAIVASWKEGSGVDFFAKSKEVGSDFQHIEEPFTSLYNTNFRLGADVLPKPVAKEVGKTAAPYAELVTQCIELEFMLKRLIRCNSSKWVAGHVQNEDGVTPQQIAYGQDPLLEPTGKHEWDLLVAAIGSHMLKINTATGTTFAGVKLEEFRPPTSAAPNAAPVAFVPKYDSFCETKDEQIMATIPTRHLNLKLDYRFPKNVPVVQYPELYLPQADVPNWDDPMVVKYKAKMIKKDEVGQADGKSKAEENEIADPEDDQEPEVERNTGLDTSYYATPSRGQKRAADAPAGSLQQKIPKMAKQSSKADKEKEEAVAAITNQETRIAVEAARKQKRADSQEAWVQACSLTGDDVAAALNEKGDPMPDSGSKNYVEFLRQALQLDTAAQAKVDEYSQAANAQEKGRITKVEQLRIRNLVKEFCTVAGLTQPTAKEWEGLQWAGSSRPKMKCDDHGNVTTRTTDSSGGKKPTGGTNILATPKADAKGKGKGKGK